MPRPTTQCRSVGGGEEGGREGEGLRAVVGVWNGVRDHVQYGRDL